MQHKHLQFGHGFRVMLGDVHSQVAQMTLGPKETEGGPDNSHRGSDRWLYVLSGTGRNCLFCRLFRTIEDKGDGNKVNAQRHAMARLGCAFFAHPSRLSPPVLPRTVREENKVVSLIALVMVFCRSPRLDKNTHARDGSSILCTGEVRVGIQGPAQNT